MSASPEQRLWRRVLFVVLADLRSSGENNHRDREFAKERVGAYPSKDFQMVCDLAGVESEPTHRYFRQLCKSARIGPCDPLRPVVRPGSQLRDRAGTYKI